MCWRRQRSRQAQGNQKLFHDHSLLIVPLTLTGRDGGGLQPKGPGGTQGTSRAARRSRNEEGGTREPPRHYAWTPYAGLTQPCHVVIKPDSSPPPDPQRGGERWPPRLGEAPPPPLRPRALAAVMCRRKAQAARWSLRVLTMLKVSVLNALCGAAHASPPSRFTADESEEGARPAFNKVASKPATASRRRDVK